MTMPQCKYRCAARFFCYSMSSFRLLNNFSRSLFFLIHYFSLCELLSINCRGNLFLVLL
uniref:Uncharacterized protein n=1 Tax=Octopus bimaculoides TaxID=37653 RepID=A0A0L8H2N5_OCTBM